MSLLTALVPALIPAAADGLRAIITRVTGGAGAKPANVGELIQLMNADTDRLRVLAQLDTPGPNVAGWVSNLRALQRPAMATWILAGYIGAMALDAPPSTVATLGEYAAMVVFYLFGDRGYSALRGSK